MSLCPVQPASPTLDHVLAQLKGVRTSLRGWRACCPAHADNEPSLSIGLGEQGQVLLKCFAGCSLERIVEAMGLTILDLFPDGATTAEQGSSNGAHHTALTLLDLAVAKQLPWKYLFHLGVMDHASGGVQIPYTWPMVRRPRVTVSAPHWWPKRDRAGVPARATSSPTVWSGWKMPGKRATWCWWKANRTAGRSGTRAFRRWDCPARR